MAACRHHQTRTRPRQPRAGPSHGGAGCLGSSRREALAGKLSPLRAGGREGPRIPRTPPAPKGRAPRSPRTKHTRAIPAPLHGQEPLPASPGPTRLLGFPGTAPQPPPRSQGTRAGPRGLTRSPGATRPPRSPAAVLVRPRPGASPPPGVPVSRCPRTCTWRWKTRARPAPFSTAPSRRRPEVRTAGAQRLSGVVVGSPVPTPGRGRAGPAAAGGEWRRLRRGRNRERPELPAPRSEPEQDGQRWNPAGDAALSGGSAVVRRRRAGRGAGRSGAAMPSHGRFSRAGTRAGWEAAAPGTSPVTRTRGKNGLGAVMDEGGQRVRFQLFCRVFLPSGPPSTQGPCGLRVPGARCCAAQACAHTAGRGALARFTLDGFLWEHLKLAVCAWC